MQQVHRSLHRQRRVQHMSRLSVSVTCLLSVLLCGHYNVIVIIAMMTTAMKKNGDETRVVDAVLPVDEGITTPPPVDDDVMTNAWTAAVCVETV